MLNKTQKAALLSETGMLGRLLVATAAVASLHGLIATYVAVILATLGSALLTVRIVTLNNTVRIAKELAENLFMPLCSSHGQLEHSRWV